MVLKSGGSSAADAEMIAAKLGTEDERWCELRSEHAFQRASNCWRLHFQHAQENNLSVQAGCEDEQV